MKKKILYISSIVLVSLLVGVFWLLRVDKEEKVDKTTVIKKEKRDSSLKSDEKVRRIIKGRVTESRKGEKKKVNGTIGEEFSHLSPTDRKLAEDVQLALDESDFESVVTAAKAALMSSNTEVRENAVEALGWFGAKALPELTLAMADKDADIAETAMQHWQQALSELNDESLQAQVAEVALPNIWNKDVVEMVVTEITGQSNELKVMQSLINLMECNNIHVVNVAKEEYESLTGETWSGIDAAEAWLRENYEPEE